MLFDLIKNIFKFKNLRAGDIIIAKRYNNIFDKYKIKKGHRIGPFIIISKKGRKICALSCTSVNKNNNVQMKMSDKYNFEKETYINLKECNIIKQKQFIKVIDKLDKKDLSRILNKTI